MSRVPEFAKHIRLVQQARDIRPDRSEFDILGFDFIAIERGRSEYWVVAAFSKLAGDGQKRVKVAEGAERT